MPLHLFSEAGIRLKQTFVPFSDWDRYIHLMKQASDWNRHLFHFQTAFDVFGIHRGTWRGGYLWPLPGEEVSGEPDVSQPTAGQHLSTKEKEKEGQETQRGIVMQCCWFQCLHIILCNCILVVNIHVCVPSKWPQQNVFCLPPAPPHPLHPQNLILYFYVCMSPHIIKMDIKSKLLGVFISKCKIHFVFDDLEISTPYIMPLNNNTFKMKSSFIFFFFFFYCKSLQCVTFFLNVNHNHFMQYMQIYIYVYTCMMYTCAHARSDATHTHTCCNS